MEKFFTPKIPFCIAAIVVIGLIAYFGVTLYGAVKTGEQLSAGTITASDLAPYLTGVVHITCRTTGGDYNGSGSLWNLPNFGYAVLTNKHVITIDGRPVTIEGVEGGSDAQGDPSPPVKNACYVNLSETDGNYYYIDLAHKYSLNEGADAAALPLRPLASSTQDQQGSLSYPPPVGGLNYSISRLRTCPATVPVGAPVAIIGYPAFGVITTSTLEIGKTNMHTYQIAETGIVSGIITQDLHTGETLTYADYFTSAKSDHGDSGGIALSKDADGLCVLGIPTWINSGDFESEGQIQNIRNVFPQK